MYLLYILTDLFLRETSYVSSPHFSKRACLRQTSYVQQTYTRNPFCMNFNIVFNSSTSCTVPRLAHTLETRFLCLLMHDPADSPGVIVSGHLHLRSGKQLNESL